MFCKGHLQTTLFLKLALFDVACGLSLRDPLFIYSESMLTGIPEERLTSTFSVIVDSKVKKMHKIGAWIPEGLRWI